MPIVTLLTDFGTSDSYVGEVKGVLLSQAPGATLVDISHDLPQGDTASAAYILGRTWRRFPAGTVHLAVIDPGVGTRRVALAMRAGEHFFVGPDNGIFGAVVRGLEVEAVALPVPTVAAPTFHGRDLFAPAAAALARGEPVRSLGTPLTQPPQRVSGANPQYQGKTVVGEVIYVDRYGNLVTNLTPAEVPTYAVVETDTAIIGPLRGTYGEVPSGGLLAYVGSGGNVELAVRDGSAARRLGMGVGARVRARLG